MAQRLELSERDFNIAMVHLISDPPGNIDSLCTYMGEFHRDMGTILKNQIEILEIEDVLSKVQNLSAELMNSKGNNQWTWRLRLRG